MRGKTIAGWTVIFLSVAAFGMYLWVIYGSKLAFRPPLFHFEETAVTSIAVVRNKEEIIFSRDEQGWMVSDGKREGLFLPTSEMSNLLNRLNNLYPQGMSAEQGSLASRVEHPRIQKARVKIIFNNRKPEIFWIEKQSGESGSASLQIDGQGEVFLIPEQMVQFFFQPFSRFRDLTLALPPIQGQADSLSYIFNEDSLSCRFIRRNEKWQIINGDTLETDSLAFTRWWSSLANHSAPAPTNDFDEVQEGRTANRSILFWSKGRPVLEISVFIRPLHRQPFVIHSSQRPGDFFACDSTGLYSRIFGALDSLIQKTQNR